MNGRFLVTTEFEFENPRDELLRIRRTIYTVMELENFIHYKDRLNAAAVPFCSMSAWRGKWSWMELRASNRVGR